MTSINPMFTEPRNIVETRKKTETPRKIRSDKTITIKFPITEEERRELRKAAIALGMGKRQTAYNTFLLLNSVREADETMEISYKDSGQYMTVNPILAVNERIQELMLQWGTSKREAVHRLMICALRRGL